MENTIEDLINSVNSELTNNGSRVPRRATVPVGLRRDGDRKTEITVEKQGETVQAIRVACRCGETTIIHCAYPDEPKTS